MQNNIKNSEIIFIYVTCPAKPFDSEQSIAEKIARNLIEKDLVACANIFPEIHSIFKWKGKVQRDTENIMLLKTKRNNFDIIEKEIKILHPYECPCIVSIPIENGNIEYMDWLKNQL